MSECCKTCVQRFKCILNNKQNECALYKEQNKLAKLKGENKKECSTCKSDNSHKDCLGCIEYGHWELKGENEQC